MVIDYGKPYERVCGHCGVAVKSCWDLAVRCGHTLAAAIPVFAEIPEDERPKTHKPRKRDVCIGNEHGVDVVAVRWDGNSRRAYSEQDQRGQIEGWSHARRVPWGVLWEGRSATLADAVLWVAEGKR